MIAKTKEFSVSVLTESAPFKIYEQFGFHSGRTTDKFAGYSNFAQSAGGIPYLTEHSNAVLCAKVVETLSYETHSVFIGEITQASVLSDEPSVTYQYYFSFIKPKPKLPASVKKGFVCKICGYIHEGDVLPEDFICPLCKHGAADFEPIKS